eukprot:TRINITY_DN67279_c7_g9_i1.p1 TRINITY_DN67279_c7_g9~~TRINITY_DN67279_c7_g9_i1.p1  ORF type:complete len:389 (-),score=26.21 TRINITY_DN67279_c7_g9_i1:1667-2833(-)
MPKKKKGRIAGGFVVGDADGWRKHLAAARKQLHQQHQQVKSACVYVKYPDNASGLVSLVVNILEETCWSIFRKKGPFVGWPGEGVWITGCSPGSDDQYEVLLDAIALIVIDHLSPLLEPEQLLVFNRPSTLVLKDASFWTGDALPDHIPAKRIPVITTTEDEELDMTKLKVFGSVSQIRAFIEVDAMTTANSLLLPGCQLSWDSLRHGDLIAEVAEVKITNLKRACNDDIRAMERPGVMQEVTKEVAQQYQKEVQAAKTTLDKLRQFAPDWHARCLSVTPPPNADSTQTSTPTKVSSTEVTTQYFEAIVMPVLSTTKAMLADPSSSAGVLAQEFMLWGALLSLPLTKEMHDNIATLCEQLKKNAPTEIDKAKLEHQRQTKKQEQAKPH